MIDEFLAITEVIKYAKEAYDMCPACFDSLLINIIYTITPKKICEMMKYGKKSNG